MCLTRLDTQPEPYSCQDTHWEMRHSKAAPVTHWNNYAIFCLTMQSECRSLNLFNSVLEQVAWVGANEITGLWAIKAGCGQLLISAISEIWDEHNKTQLNDNCLLASPNQSFSQLCGLHLFCVSTRKSSQGISVTTKWHQSSWNKKKKKKSKKRKKKGSLMSASFRTMCTLTKSTGCCL